MKTRLGRYWPVIIVTLAALVLPLTVLAQSDGTPRPAPVVLTGSQGEYPLGLHLELLEDPIGELTIEEVVSPEYDDQFRGLPGYDGTPKSLSIICGWAL